WRRSARSSCWELGTLDEVAASTEGVLPLSSLRRAAIASSSLRRCPNDVTPSSFRSSAVRLKRTVSSMSFSRNSASYFPRPRLRSQTTMSITSTHHRGGAYHVRLKRVCPGRAGSLQWAATGRAMHALVHAAAIEQSSHTWVIDGASLLPT